MDAGTRAAAATTAPWRSLIDTVRAHRELDIGYLLSSKGIPMDQNLSRRDLLKLTAAQALWALPTGTVGAIGPKAPIGWVSGTMTGAQALVETLLYEGTDCVFGIPGA